MANTYPDPALNELDQSTGPYGLRQWSGWVLGPGALLATLLASPPAGLSAQGWHTAGAAVLMAVFWITESLPITVTALLPLVLFPALGLGNIQETAAPFANPVIYLFLGGFIIALAMQRWHFQRRVAVGIVGFMGTRPSRIIAGFLLASALISMWVSNTATALMMLPIALSVVQLLPAGAQRTPGMKSFATALLLSVAYGSTTGGMGTLIGTPPNALLAGYVAETYHITIGFGQWMLLGVPVVIVSLPLVYLVLTKIVFKLDAEDLPGMAGMIAAQKAELGPFSRGERAVAIVFAGTAMAWVFQPLIAEAIPLVSDTTIAMTGALLLFVIPVNLRRGEFVMTWEATAGLPWDVLLLFGGGLSLAANIEKHGLSSYLGALCATMNGLPILVILAVVCFGLLMLGELTSNTAAAATFLPITAALAIGLGQNPLLFVIPTALACNCSYTLPVGTPPNAIVFGRGLVTLPQMAKAGFLIDVILVPVIVGMVWLLGPLVFGIEPNVMPLWVK